MPISAQLSRALRLGKVKVTPHDTSSQFGGEKIGGRWEWRPYGDAQVAIYIAALDGLCDAIETRIVGNDNAATGQSHSEPLLTPAVLDTASVPDGFARAFLTRARRPRFRHVAPGLALPLVDAADSKALQRFAQQQRPGLLDIPSVCLFPVAQRGLESNITGSLSPLLSHSYLSRVPAGFYEEFEARSL
ncbi:uncharacterized protein CCOS01_09719 [Colletotrichum costaricense]|uniref:Uncharacterized protein n=1 Tax=Colletotrichum costaricense TaxID=1209916 RepID=A0AAJ0DYH1_9PEZI|nr:uncharacterized protein CCOS01_09719 [Colletotrichum costaricense]KAK1522007.1 hypothetical protein CCOS01_09719 [Colletotrichum costaricense]